MSKQGVLLINLGTPDAADIPSVKRYLKQFLSDPRVIDIPALLRFLLLNLFILPKRSKTSTHAYQQIWTEQGSPLLVNTQALAQALSQALGSGYQVEFAMRYANPSIDSVLTKFKNCEHLQVIPLFPQYTSAATGSVIEDLFKSLSKQWNIPSLKIKHDFYQDPGYIHAYSELIKQHTQGQQVDLILFSYHGLPERHITKSECRAVCDHKHACPLIHDNNRFCYRAQCYATSAAIAHELNLLSSQYQVSFQSRLGSTPWIKPYTDVVLAELIKRGVKRIAVVCPSFVSDCLETLEEVNIRTRAQWQALGGEHFVFVPCLNAELVWVQALREMIIA